MNKVKDLPWQLSFSFERGLEGPAMEVWEGSDSNKEKVQKEFYKRAKLNSLARKGEYSQQAEES